MFCVHCGKPVEEDQLFCAQCGHKTAHHVSRNTGSEAKSVASAPLSPESGRKLDYSTTVNDFMSFLHLNLHKIIAFLCLLTLMYPIVRNILADSEAEYFSTYGRMQVVDFGVGGRAFEVWKFFIFSRTDLADIYGTMTGVIAATGILLFFLSVALIVFTILTIVVKGRKSIFFSNCAVSLMIAVAAVAIISVFILNAQFDSILSALENGSVDREVLYNYGGFLYNLRFVQPANAYWMVIGGVAAILVNRVIKKTYPVNE